MSAASSTPGRFDGQVAIVTGAASGIGRATALRLAAEGAAVACLDVAEEGLAQTMALMASASASASAGAGAGSGAAGSSAAAAGKILALRCDVTDEANIGSVVAETVASLGAPDVLCNVAGIGTFAHTHEMPLASWDRIVGVNLTGTFIVTKAVLPSMLERGKGSIVNTASTAALTASAYSAAYCASKGGVLMMTKALAVEYADRRIRFNAVAPGGVDTPLIANFALPEGGDPRHFHKIMTPMGFSTPEQIAAAICFLASDESDYTTGAVLAVDGGVTA
ncbi:MAG: SDR family NAD(P)-dependent oxidoreductase [Acidimicrobiales bacterium]